MNGYYEYIGDGSDDEEIGSVEAASIFAARRPKGARAAKAEKEVQAQLEREAKKESGGDSEDPAEDEAQESDMDGPAEDGEEETTYEAEITADDDEENGDVGD